MMGKTALYLGVTAALVVGAFFTVPSSEEPEIFNDSGSEFFPEFSEPDKATALEVVSFESETASLDLFRVEKQDGRWTIPSPPRLSGRCERPHGRGRRLSYRSQQDRCSVGPGGRPCRLWRDRSEGYHGVDGWPRDARSFRGRVRQ